MYLELCILVAILVTNVAAGNECIWATGLLECAKDPSLVRNSVVEVWDRDGRKVPLINIVDPDDKAGMTVVDNDDGIFKVEGCASDFNWLGPVYKNKPEFYLKIRHKCKSDRYDEITVEFPQQYRRVYAPVSIDYFVENPIQLD